MAGRRGAGRLDPDVALEISLNGTAGRLASDGTPRLEAIDQLRELAAGRNDLLAKAAGSMIGGYLGSPMANPQMMPAAHLLILAGADKEHEALVVAADQARRNASGSSYSL